jgi:hypothetical protein
LAERARIVLAAAAGLNNKEIADAGNASERRDALEPEGPWPRRLPTAPSTVHRIWSVFGLQPHRVETFKLSPDPLFVEKVRDIVGLYLSPPERAVVLCVDEKSQVQALDPHAATAADASRPARTAHP